MSYILKENLQLQVEIKLEENKGGRSKLIQKPKLQVQVSDDGGLGQADGGTGSIKWLDLRYVFKEQPAGFVDGLDV